MSFDVIIVGAGPAGSTAGKILAKHGVNTLIVDSSTFPRPKACGELVTNKTANLISQIFQLDSNCTLYTKHSSKAAIFSKSTLLTETTSDYPFHFIKRENFDFSLIQSAIESGAKFKDGHKVIDVDIVSNTVTFQNGDKERAEVIIGADGSLSCVAKKIYGRQLRYKKQMAIGISIKVSKEYANQKLCGAEYLNRPNVYFNVVDWGYGWVFPNEGYLNVGMAGLMYKNPDIRKKLNAFLKILPIDFSKKISFNSHPIPYGKRSIRTGHGNILLIGDSAGFIEPVTGEGLYYAIKSAQIAADTYLNNLGNDKFLYNYKNKCKYSFLKQLNQAFIARYLLYSKPIMPHALNRIGRSQKWTKGYMNVLSGERDYISYIKEAFSIR